MPLRPLHFVSRMEDIDPVRAERASKRERKRWISPSRRLVPAYGTGEYITACGRFSFRRRDGGWRILNSAQDFMAGEVWGEWLESAGLSGAILPTRREAVETLESALVGDGLLDAESP